MSESLRRHHEGQNLPHKRGAFYADIRYIRQVLRQMEASVKAGDWADVEEGFNEISGTTATLSAFGFDNRLNRKDAHTLDAWQLREEGMNQ